MHTYIRIRYEAEARGTANRYYRNESAQLPRGRCTDIMHALFDFNCDRSVTVRTRTSVYPSPPTRFSQWYSDLGSNSPAFFSSVTLTISPRFFLREMIPRQLKLNGDFLESGR